MKPFEHRRTPRIALALVAGAFLYAAPAVHADLPTWEEEAAIEATCEEWQKVRRCLQDDGEVGLECAAKSPFARFLSMFRTRQEDDEVHVVVVREAPPETGRTVASPAAPATEAERSVDPATAETAGETVRTRETDHGSYERRVVRAETDLPRCEEGNG